MITINLRDTHLKDNVKAIRELRHSFLSDDEIQKLYDKQVATDTIRDNSNRCVCCGEVVPEGKQVCPSCEAKNAL